MIRSNIDPDPDVTVRPVPVEGKTVLLEVPAGSRWYVYGRERPEIYLRRGANTIPPRLPEIIQPLRPAADIIVLAPGQNSDASADSGTTRGDPGRRRRPRVEPQAACPSGSWVGSR